MPFARFLVAPVPEEEDVLLVGKALVDEFLGEFLPGGDEVEDGLFVSFGHDFELISTFCCPTVCKDRFISQGLV